MVVIDCGASDRLTAGPLTTPLSFKKFNFLMSQLHGSDEMYLTLPLLATRILVAQPMGRLQRNPISLYLLLEYS